MWLTRSTRPFVFQNEYDEVLPFAECGGLGLYVHIPFCRQLCAFCPYCKELYAPEKCSRYIDALLEEIHRVGGQYPGRKEATSLYFGGGTPALAAHRLGEIIAALNQHFTITQGVGVELHPDNVTVPVLETLKAAGVTKISIGIQSFQNKYQSILGRSPVNAAELAKALSAVPFETVSMDFIFALPGQTLEDLKADLDAAFQSGANHVAIYPFIDFTFTSSQIPPMPKKEKRALLDGITRYCTDRGCARSSIWTFSSQPQAHYSSMTRDNFLGFGCSATTLLGDQFKINTFSTEEYCRRIGEGRLPTALTLRFTRRQRMVYYLFWTAYSTQVNARDFEAFFGVPLEKMYGLELKAAKALGLVTEQNGVYQMTLRGAFYYHYYENFYTLAYIDKMWSLMRREAFPPGMTL
jgi:oxygen-independent coproporphyrinogen-3 oxidase